MIPFYLGKLFRQSGASDDVCSKLGIGKEKALSITRSVQKYGNLIGSVGDWLSIEGAPCVCPCYSCNSCGNLDCVSICRSCCNSNVPLPSTPLLYIDLLKLFSARRFDKLKIEAVTFVS